MDRNNQWVFVLWTDITSGYLYYGQTKLIDICTVDRQNSWILVLWIDRASQIDTQTDIQLDRQTVTQIDRQLNRQLDRQIDSPISVTFYYITFNMLTMWYVFSAINTYILALFRVDAILCTSSATLKCKSVEIVFLNFLIERISSLKVALH